MDPSQPATFTKTISAARAGIAHLIVGGLLITLLAALVIVWAAHSAPQPTQMLWVIVPLAVFVMAIFALLRRSHSTARAICPVEIRVSPTIADPGSTIRVEVRFRPTRAVPLLSASAVLCACRETPSSSRTRIAPAAYSQESDLRGYPKDGQLQEGVAMEWTAEFIVPLDVEPTSDNLRWIVSFDMQPKGGLPLSESTDIVIRARTRGGGERSG